MPTLTQFIWEVFQLKMVFANMIVLRIIKGGI